jgi:intracellular septation protein
MKLLFDFLPLLLFFAAFKMFGTYVATAVGIAATVVQVGWLKLRRQPVPAPLWLGLVVFVVFGGATLIWRDESFLKLKPTVVSWTMAATLFVGRLLNRDFLKLLLGEKLEVPPEAWRLLTWMWTAFFVVLGGANLYVAHHFPMASWVTFKVFWVTGLTFVFAVVQVVFVLNRYLPDEEKKRAN